MCSLNPAFQTDVRRASSLNAPTLRKTTFGEVTRGEGRPRPHHNGWGPSVSKFFRDPCLCAHTVWPRPTKLCEEGVFQVSTRSDMISVAREWNSRPDLLHAPTRYDTQQPNSDQSGRQEYHRLDHAPSLGRNFLWDKQNADTRCVCGS